GGMGEAPTNPCSACRGDGRVMNRRTTTVETPAGVDDGTTLRMRAQGEAGVRGGADGDLFIRINVKPHEFFARRGENLECELNVPLTQAVLGADIPVQTLDGTETVKIAAGTQHGSIVKLRGHGVPRLDGRGRGDLLVHVTVDVPSHIKGEQPSPRVIVFPAMPKAGKLDAVVQKLTELGVDEIRPWFAKRSVIRWDAGKTAGRTARLRAIAREAAMQARRAWLPEVAEPGPLEHLPEIAFVLHESATAGLIAALPSVAP